MNPRDFWKELRKNYVQMIWLYLLIVLLMVAFPFILHILYSMNTNTDYWIPKWEIGNMLSYLGSCLGACVTIISLTSTIVFNIAQQNAQRRLAIKPHLSAECRTLNSFIDSDIERRFISLKPLAKKTSDEKDMLDFVPPDFYKNAYNNSGHVYQDDIRIVEFRKTFHVIEFLLSNNGADSAIVEEFKIIDLQPNQTLFNCCFVLSKGHTLSLIFLLPTSLLEGAAYRKFCFAFTYSDVASTGKYMQNAEIVVSFDKATSTYDIKSQQLSPPIDIIAKPDKKLNNTFKKKKNGE